MATSISKYFDQPASPARKRPVNDHPMAVQEREFAISMLAARLSYADRRRLEGMVAHLSYQSSKQLCDAIYACTHSPSSKAVTSFEQAVAVLRPWL